MVGLVFISTVLMVALTLLGFGGMMVFSLIVVFRVCDWVISGVHRFIRDRRREKEVKQLFQRGDK